MNGEGNEAPQGGVEQGNEWDTLRDYYKQEEGESAEDYEKRIEMMTEYSKMAVEDGEKAAAEKAAAEYVPTMDDKFEEMIRNKIGDVYTQEEAEQMIERRRTKTREQAELDAALERMENGEREEFEGEHVRGGNMFDMYPRMKGESSEEYGRRLREIREHSKMAEEDGQRAEAAKAAEEYVNSKLGKFEARLREKIKSSENPDGIYTEEEVERMVERERLSERDKERLEQHWQGLEAADGGAERMEAERRAQNQERGQEALKDEEILMTGEGEPGNAGEGGADEAEGDGAGFGTDGEGGSDSEAEGEETGSEAEGEGEAGANAEGGEGEGNGANAGGEEGDGAEGEEEQLTVEQHLENIFGKNLNAVQVNTAGENSEAIEQMAMRAVQQRMNEEQKTNRNIGQLLLGGLRSKQGRDLNHEFWEKNGKLKGLGKAIVNTVKYGVLKPFTMGKALRQERQKIVESGNIYAGVAEDGGEGANAAIAERFASADREDDELVRNTLLSNPEDKINRVGDDDMRLKHIRSQLANLAGRIYDANGDAEAEAAALADYNKFLDEQRKGGDLDKFVTSADNFAEMGTNVLNNTKEAMTKADMSRGAILSYIRDHVSFAEGSARVGVNTKAELDRTTKLLGSAVGVGLVAGTALFVGQRLGRTVLKGGVTAGAVALTAGLGGVAVAGAVLSGAANPLVGMAASLVGGAAASGAVTAGATLAGATTMGATIAGAATGGAVFGALRGRQRGKEAVSNREYDRTLSGAEGGSGEGEKDKIGYENTVNAMSEMLAMRALMNGEMSADDRKALSKQLAGLYARIGRGAKEGADLVTYDIDGDAGKLEEQRTALLNTMAEARKVLGPDGENQLLDDIGEWNQVLDEDIEETNKRRRGYVARRAALSGTVGGVAAGTAAAVGQMVRGALDDDAADNLEDKTDTVLEDGGDELQAPEYDLTTLASTKVNIIKNGDSEGGYEVFANTEGDDGVMEQVMVNGHELAIQFENDGSGKLTDETLQDLQAAGFKAFVDTNGNGQYEAVDISEAGDMMYTGELTGASTVMPEIANARLYMESLREGATNPELGGAGVQNVEITEWAGKGEEVWLGQPTLSEDGTKYVIDLVPRDGDTSKLEGLEVALTPSEATTKALTYEVTNGRIEIDADSVGASMIAHDDAGAASLAAFKSQVIENLDNGGVKSWGTTSGTGVEAFQVNTPVAGQTVPQYSFLYGDQRVDITPPAATYSETVGANESYFTEFYNSGNAEVIATDQNITLNGETVNGVRIDGGYDNTLNTFNTQAAERITAHNNGAPLYEGVSPQGQEVAMAREYAEEIVTNPHDAALMRMAFGMDNGDGAGANGTIDDINELNSYVNNVLMGGDNDGYDAIVNDTADEFMSRINGGSVELIDATTAFRSSVYEYRGANDMTITMGIANRILNKGDEHFLLLRNAAGENALMEDPAQVARLREFFNVPKDAEDVQFVINPSCRQLTAVYNMPDTPTPIHTSDVIEETPVSNRAEEITTSNINEEITTSNLNEEITTSNVNEEITTSDINAELTTSNINDEITTSNVNDEITTSDLNAEITTSNVNEEITTSNLNEEITTSNVNEEITTSDLNAEITTSNINAEITTSNINEEITTSNVNDEITTSDINAELTTSNINDEITTSNVNDEITTSNLNEEITTSNINEEITTSDVSAEVTTSDVATEVTTSDEASETTLEPKDPNELEENMGNDRTDQQDLDDDVTPPTEESNNNPGDYNRDDGTFGKPESGDGDEGHASGGQEVVTGQDQNGDDITGHQQNIEENPETTHSGDGSGRTEQEVIDQADQTHAGDVNRTPEDAAQHAADAAENAAGQAAQDAADAGAGASEQAAEDAVANTTEEGAGNWFDIISGGGQ